MVRQNGLQQCIKVKIIGPPSNLEMYHNAAPTLSTSSVLCSILQQEHSHYAQKGFLLKKENKQCESLLGQGSKSSSCR